VVDRLSRSWNGCHVIVHALEDLERSVMAKAGYVDDDGKCVTFKASEVLVRAFWGEAAASGKTAWETEELAPKKLQALAKSLGRAISMVGASGIWSLMNATQEIIRENMKSMGDPSMVEALMQAALTMRASQAGGGKAAMN
jgi:hypothetical protein